MKRLFQVYGVLVILTVVAAAGYQFGRSTAAGAVARHVIHAAVMAGCQPLQQKGFIVIQLRVGDADLLEAEFLTPALDLLAQRRVIKLWVGCGCRHIHCDWIFGRASRYVAVILH